MSKTMLGTYPFNASAKTVDLSSIPDYTFQQLRLIYNLTVRLPIYVNTSSTFTGSMDGGSLVFDASNAGMQNTDELEIIYDDQSAQPVSVTNPPADYPSTETVAAIAETNTAIANLQTVLSEFSANLAEVTKNVAVTLNGRATTGTGAVVSTDGSTVTWPLTGALLNAVQMSNTLITPDQGPVFIAVSWPAGTEPEYGEFQSVLAGFVAAYYDPDQVVSNGLSGGALPLATAQGTVAISLPHSVEFNNGSGSTYAADYDFGPEWVVFIGYNPVNGQVFIRSVKGSHITNAGPFNTGLTGLPVQAFIGVSMSSSTPANAGLQLLSNAGLAAIAASWGDYYYAWPGYTNVADPDFQLLTYDYETHDALESIETALTTAVSKLSTIATNLPAKGSANSAASMPVTIATDDAQWGTDGTGITQPTGGSGARGWWSGIYSQALAIVASLGGDGAGESPANGTGVRGWLRSIYDRLTAGIGLNAGTNIIGKVGIDQTTPGTTNGVVVNNSALPAGAATDTSVQAITTSLGTKADSAASTDTGTFSLIALTKRLLTKIPVLGAAATASSMPTTVATDDAQWGTDGTGITQPAGGTGIRGWLSGIFNLQNSTVSGGRVQTRALTAATDTVTIVASDTTPSTQTITAADAATTSATGQGSQIIYTGTPTANSVAQFTLAGQQTVGLQLTGVVAGNLYQVEVSIDGTNWYLRTLTLSAITWANISANCLGSVNVAGMKYLRVRCTTYVSGTATVALTESLNESNITVSAPADIVYPTASITATGFYLFPVPQGYQSAQFSIYGTFSATMTFVGTVDSAGVTAFSAGAILTNAVSSTGGTSSTTGAGNFELAIPVGSKYVGVLVTAYASGTVSLSVSLSTRAARVYSTGSSVSVTSATGGILGLTGTASDGMSISTSALNVAQQMSYNGSNYDRLRNNTSGTITASGAITSSAGSTAQTNYNAKGVIVTLNITAYSGTSPTITLQLQTQDAAGNWVNIPGAATATISAANGSYVLVLYPGIAAYSTSPGWAVSGALPRNWRVYSTIGGSGSPSITCSLGYNYIL
jgi:hypothetical protein